MCITQKVPLFLAAVIPASLWVIAHLLIAAVGELLLLFLGIVACGLLCLV